MISPLLVLALGTAASEDLTCIAAGVLIAQGTLGFGEGVAACLAGIVTGDLLLFLAGRWLGSPALRMPWFQRVMPAHKLDRASAWLKGKGMTAVLLSRFTPGLRMATYFAAGSLRMPFRSFASYFVLASFVWTPLLVGSTVLFGERLLKSIFGNQAHTAVAFAAIFGLGLINLLLSHQLSTFERRERFGKGLLSRSRENGNTQMCTSSISIP